MPLIFCPQCGYRFSDQAKACPQCKMSMKAINKLKRSAEEWQNTPTDFCPECGRAVPFDENKCPSCGCPIKNKKPKPSLKVKKKSFIIALISIVFVISIVSSVFLIKNLFPSLSTPKPSYFRGNIFQIITYDLDEIPLATGSGFIYDEQGHFVTNSHVLEGAYSAYAVFDIPNKESGEDYTYLKILQIGYYSENEDICIGRVIA